MVDIEFMRTIHSLLISRILSIYKAEDGITCKESKLIYKADLLSSTVSVMSSAVSTVVPLTTPPGSSVAQGVVKISYPSGSTSGLLFRLQFAPATVIGTNFHISNSQGALATVTIVHPHHCL